MNNTMERLRADILRMRTEIHFIEDLARVSPTPWKTNRLRALRAAVADARENIREIQREEVGADNIIGAY